MNESPHTPRLLGLLIMSAITLPMFAQEPAPPPLPAETSPASRSETNYHISTRLFQIRGSVSGQMSLSEDIGWRDAQGQPASVNNGIQAFTTADLTIAGARYRFDGEGFEWEPSQRPIEQDVADDADDAESEISRVVSTTHRDSDTPHGVDMLVAPSILVRPGQDAAIHVKPTSRFQYLERLENGLFELHEAESSTGVELHTTVKPNADGSLQIDPLKIILSTVKSREPIEDVDLNIGKPIISQDTLIQSMRIRPDTYYGLLWNSGSNGQIHIILKVTPITRTP